MIIEEKNLNLVKRIKLKRQTKIICTLDEKWNNYENISRYVLFILLFFRLLSHGVDAIELYSEMNEEVKKINK